ncbi:MAG TPA: AAA family ATPase [Burkholderiales bacterium]
MAAHMRSSEGLHSGRSRGLRGRFGLPGFRSERREPLFDIDVEPEIAWPDRRAAPSHPAETGASEQAAVGPVESDWARLQRCGDLVLDEAGDLSGTGRVRFLRLRDDPSLPRPPTLLTVSHDGSIYFLVPATLLLPERWTPELRARLPRSLVAKASPNVPDDFHWPDGSGVIAAIEEHEQLVFHVRTLREARELLARERDPGAELYGSAGAVAHSPPMLVEGLMREHGISVVYGAFDAFKTTLVLDLAAHVAMGAPWQGRAVSHRPVVWYALDGADDVALRLSAIETELRHGECGWGQDRAPFSVRRRIPEDYLAWRAELCRIAERWEKIGAARDAIGEMPPEASAIDRIARPPLVVIDALSMALGNEFEQGPRAARFIQECVDLLRERQDLTTDGPASDEKRAREHGPLPATIASPVASHIILIHQQTTARTEFDGPGVVLANSQALFRVHRFGEIEDEARPMAGQLTPMRVKGMVRPPPVRFAVEAVPIEGTPQTTAILSPDGGF